MQENRRVTSYLELIQNGVSPRKMVPRDRIELSTPAFSGLTENNGFQLLMRFRRVKQRQRASCKINGLQGPWAAALTGNQC